MLKKILSKSILAAAAASVSVAACGGPEQPAGVGGGQSTGVGGGQSTCVVALPPDILARDVPAYVDLAMRADGCGLGDPTLRAQVLRIDSGAEPAPYLRAVLRVASAETGGDAEMQSAAQ
jgi:hypothetical protein